MNKVLTKISFIWLFALCLKPDTDIFAQSLAMANVLNDGEFIDQGKTPLKNVLKSIEAKENVSFSYNEEFVGNIEIDQSFGKSLDWKKDLTRVIEEFGLTMDKLKDNYYVIYKKEEEKSPTLILETIKGTVKDSEGAPLIGVLVQVKGSDNGVVTDLDGNFSIEVKEKGEVLVFSYLGFKKEEITYTGQQKIDVVLQDNINSLSEVVVIGYATQKRSDLTGAVSSVSSEELTAVSERRIETALQGRAAGVTVTRGEGAPGSSAKVSIRGIGTLNDNAPLYIIDGVPQEPNNFLNPQDIESIEVLKDASAAAIYGARAAHGVVIITTKRGNKGKTTMNVNSSIGFRDAFGLPNVLSTPDYIDRLSLARANAGIAPEPSWADPNSLPNTNWMDEVFRTALEQSHQLSVAGGGEKSNFFLSGGYDREEGIYIDNAFERYTLRANSDFEIGKILTVGESFTYSRTWNNPTADNGKDLELPLRAVPTYNAFDPSNPIGGFGIAPSYNNGANPVGRQLQVHENTINRRIFGNIYAELEPIENLKIRGNFGYNYASGLFNQFNEVFDYGAQSSNTASLRYSSSDSESTNLNAVISYNKSFGYHNLSAMGGVERFMNDGIGFDRSQSGFLVGYTDSFGLSTSNEITANDFNTRGPLYRLDSQFGRLSYDFNGKYLFQANIRRDGSSRFGPNEKYGVFPSASLGWRISDEEFLNNVIWLSNLKVRGSYGILGSDRIGNYLFDPSYSSSRSLYVFEPTGINMGTDAVGFYLSSASNADLRWEEVEQLDIGLDASFLEGRFTLNADYYKKTTNDLLVNVQLPLSFGVSTEGSGPQSIPFNVGSMVNSGFELALNYKESINDWRFDISTNAAWIKNEVLKLADDQPILRTGGGQAIGGAISITEPGQPIGTFYGLIADGIIQSEEQINALNASAPDGLYQNNGTGPGDLLYRDLNGDGHITNEDRTHLGNPVPKMTYAFNLKFGWKNLDFTAFFQGVSNLDVFNATKAYYNQFYSDFNSTYEVYNTWTSENTTATNPRLNVNDPNNNFGQSSSYFIEDGSFLKLRSVRLGYNFSESALSRVGVTKARIFFNAQNILTITKYSGLDPEVSNGDGNNTFQGVDGLGRYPQTTLLSTGINLTF